MESLDIYDKTSFKTDTNIQNVKKECILSNHINSIGLQKIKEITRFMKKSICRIDCENLKGTGFLCKIKIPNSIIINALITCNHVLNENRIKRGDKINISFNNEKLKFIITIEESTYVYTDKDYDITIIEIRDNKYKKDFLFLEIDIDINAENPKDIYKDKDILVFHYEKGKEVKYSIGKLNNMNSEHIFHCCTTQEGSSGSPILKLEDYKVIGIHIGGVELKEKNEKSNVGTFIKKPIDDFIKKYTSFIDKLDKHINNSLNNKKKSNIEKVPSPNCKLKIIIAIIIPIIIVVVAIILIVKFGIKSKYINENNSITIIYKKQVDKYESITIFGDNFVESNALSCKIYYNGKKYSLRNTFSKADINEKDEILKIQLTEINNIKNIKGMFKGCKALISLPDISKIETSNIIDMSEIFSGCKSLSNLPSSLNWNTEKVLNMSYMFYECESLTSLPDISNWKTHNVKDFRGMFFGCSLLKNLPDISKWNTSKINTITRMFSSCSSIISLPDISKWDTSNVVDMSDIFSGCHYLYSLPDISKWKTDKVENMQGMFYGCKSLTSLPDISKWNINKVTNMKAMFYECESLQYFPNISHWNINNNTNIKDMFYGCKFDNPINEP